MSMKHCPECGKTEPVSDGEGKVYNVTCPACQQKKTQEKKRRDFIG